MKRFITMAMALSSVVAFAQSEGRVGINIDKPRATLDIHGKPLNDQNKNFAQGVSFPNFSTSERAAFRNVLKGTMIYNTTKSCIEICTGEENGIPQWSCMRNDEIIANTIDKINNWEYLIIKYRANKIGNKNLDLDSRTWWISGVSDPSPVGCGYSSIGQKNNALVWGGDNKVDGTESVMISKQDIISMLLLEGKTTAELRLDTYLWDGEANELSMEIIVYPVGTPAPTLQNNVFTSPVRSVENFTTSTFTWNGVYNMVSSYPDTYKNILTKGTNKCGWNNWDIMGYGSPEERAQRKAYPFSNTKLLVFKHDILTGNVQVIPRL